MGKYKTLAKNTGFVFIGTIGSKVINFIMLPLYTHWLTPSEFGSVDTMNTYAMFIVGFVCLCIPDAIFVFPKNVDDKKKSEYFSSGLSFSLIALSLSAFLFYSVSELMDYYGWNNVFSNYVWLIYGLMVSTFLQNYFQSFTRSLDKMMHYSIAGIVLTFAIAFFSILFIPKLGLYGYAYALIAAHVVTAIYSFIAAKSYKYLTLHNSTVSSVKEMLAYSAPLLPNGIMWWLVDGVNRPVMEKFLGLSAIGIYAVAQKFSGLLYSMLNVFTLAWSNSALDEFGKPGFEKFYNNYLKMLSVILVLGGIVICAFCRLLVQIFTSAEYYDAYKYIPVLTLSVLFSGMSGTVGGIFSAVKKSKYFFYSSIYGGISSVIALVSLTPLFGLMGTVISVAVSFFVMLIARIVYSSRYAKIECLSTLAILFFLYIVIVIVEIKIDSYLRFIVYFFTIGMIGVLFKNDLLEIKKILSAKLPFIKR